MRFANWLESHGGLCSDAALTRRVTATLCKLQWVHEGLLPLSVDVLDSDSVGAYSWPNGRVFVTRGLVAGVGDEQLMAAIAHEAGHLVLDGHAGRPAAFDGPTASVGGENLDVESSADRVAAVLLSRAGVRPEALADLLAMLARRPEFSIEQRRAFATRMARLRS